MLTARGLDGSRRPDGQPLAVASQDPFSVGTKGKQWGQGAGDIFGLCTSPPSDASPGEACCLSSPHPWALALETSKVLPLQAPRDPEPGCNLLVQPPTQSTHHIDRRQMKAGRSHFTTSPSLQTSCPLCQEGVLS